MAGRVQSPSSINLFRQCPRKYFYQYILKLVTGSNIHLVRGKAVHSVLENFFKVNISQIHSENFDFELRTLLFDMFRQEWRKSKPELEKIGITIHNQIYYYNETKRMLTNWFDGFVGKLQGLMVDRGLVEGFKYLTPITEQYYESSSHKVRGYIDAVHEWAEGVHIVDYKTSSRDKMSDDYMLQLGIYAMMYKQKHGVAPKKEGINFLKFGEKFIDVDDVLIRDAEAACEQIQFDTQSEEKIDYPKKQSGLCKWSTGQCDFYETCIKDN